MVAVTRARARAQPSVPTATTSSSSTPFVSGTALSAPPRRGRRTVKPPLSASQSDTAQVLQTNTSQPAKKLASAPKSSQSDSLHRPAKATKLDTTLHTTTVKPQSHSSTLEHTRASDQPRKRTRAAFNSSIKHTDPVESDTSRLLRSTTKKSLPLSEQTTVASRAAAAANQERFKKKCTTRNNTTTSSTTTLSSRSKLLVATKITRPTSAAASSKKQLAKAAPTATVRSKKSATNKPNHSTTNATACRNPLKRLSSDPIQESCTVISRAATSSVKSTRIPKEAPPSPQETVQLEPNSGIASKPDDLPSDPVPISVSQSINQELPGSSASITTECEPQPSVDVEPAIFIHPVSGPLVHQERNTHEPQSGIDYNGQNQELTSATNTSNSIESGPDSDFLLKTPDSTVPDTKVFPLPDIHDSALKSDPADQCIPADAIPSPPSTPPKNSLLGCELPEKTIEFIPPKDLLKTPSPPTQSPTLDVGIGCEILQDSDNDQVSPSSQFTCNTSPVTGPELDGCIGDDVGFFDAEISVMSLAHRMVVEPSEPSEYSIPVAESICRPSQPCLPVKMSVHTAPSTPVLGSLRSDETPIKPISRLTQSAVKPGLSHSTLTSGTPRRLRSIGHLLSPSQAKSPYRRNNSLAKANTGRSSCIKSKETSNLDATSVMKSSFRSTITFDDFIQPGSPLDSSKNTKVFSFGARRSMKSYPVLHPSGRTPDLSMTPAHSSLKRNETRRTSPKKSVTWNLPESDRTDDIDEETRKFGVEPKPTNSILRGVRAFLEVRSEGGYVNDLFESLLTEMGGVCVSLWTSNAQEITHVIFQEGTQRTLEKVVASKGAVKCVSVSWLLDCERSRKRLDESRYLIDLSSVPGYGISEKTDYLSVETDLISKRLQTNLMLGLDDTPHEQTNGNPMTLATSRNESLNVAACITSTQPPGRKSLLVLVNANNANESMRPFAGQTGSDDKENLENSQAAEAYKTSAVCTPVKTSYCQMQDVINGAYEETNPYSSPVTPYFLYPEKLEQRTCPARTRSTDMLSGNSHDRWGDYYVSFARRLDLAQRNNGGFAPRISSPLRNMHRRVSEREV